MNIGNIVTQALLRSDLSVSDFALREMAIQMLDEEIQYLWNFQDWFFAKSLFSIATAEGVEEYALDKHSAGPQAMLPHSFRGSNPVRRIRYEPAMEYYRKRAYTPENADPYYYREGDVRGFETQVSASSTITFVSSLANYTSGNANVIYGSRRVVLAGGTITLDMLGRYFRVGSESKRYKITSFESSTIFYLDAPYEGATNASASYTIGDINQKCLAEGYNDAGAVIEEEVQLNGDTPVTTTQSFQLLNRVSKSDKTHGSVSATSNGGIITNAVLDPGETEVDFYTVKLYPIPTKVELLTYENFMRHPHLWKPTDSPLFPNQYHPLLVTMLYIRLMQEWSKKEVAQDTISRRNSMIDRMIDINNDTSNQRLQQETEADSNKEKIRNMPINFGVDEDVY